MPLVYHERQQSALCGQHCLNNLLQGPYFSEFELAEIAQGLDKAELELMLESGVTSDAERYMSEGSGNVALDGNFSVQVLAQAVRHC